MTTESNCSEKETGLSVFAKALFMITVIVMAIVTCRTHSYWWLIGYGFIAVGSANALLNYKMPNERAVYLLICVVILGVLTGLSFGSSSVGWPIAQIVIAVFTAGGLQNQLDESKGKDQEDDHPKEDRPVKHSPGNTVQQRRPSRPAADPLIEKLLDPAVYTDQERVGAMIQQYGISRVTKAIEELYDRAKNDDIDAGVAWVAIGMNFMDDVNEEALTICGTLLGRAAARGQVQAKQMLRRMVQMSHGAIPYDKKAIMKTILNAASEECSLELC